MMLLWIRRVFSTRSAVYAGANWLDKDCIQPAQMLEKKRLVDQGVVFAHPILCISSGLSTAELPSGLFLLAKQGEAVFPLPGRAHSAQRCNAGSLPLADATPAWPRSRSGLPSPFVPFRQRGQKQIEQGRQDFGRFRQTRAQRSFFPQSIVNASSRLFAKPFFSSVRDSVCSTAGGFFLLFPRTCALHLLNK